MEVHVEDTDDASNIPSSGGPMSPTSIVGSVVENVEHETQTVHSAASMIGPIEGFEPQRTFETAWHSIGGDAVKQFWEEGFWADLFNPLADPLSSLESRGLKRSFEEASDLPVEDVVEQVRVPEPKTLHSFMSVIKHGAIRSWEEQNSALWQRAIRRWHALIESWSGSSPVVYEIQSRDSFKEQAQILVDIFFNKSASTLLKRCNSLARLTTFLRNAELTFPCDESQLYMFLCNERDQGAPASRLTSLMQAVTFCRHVLGVEELDYCTKSKRCHGAAQGGVSHPLKQAPPLRVEHLKIIHSVLMDDPELWNKAMAGMLLFCCYARARWDDAQHSESLFADYDDLDVLQFVEASTRVHKTAKAIHLRNIALPLVAPSFGISSDNWGRLWLKAREDLGIDNLEVFPLMPAPGKDGSATCRPVSTDEAGKWLNFLLQRRLDALMDVRYTSHSLKATCLSYCAKRGMSFEDRLALGYHAEPLKMALTYSRDGAARPLSLLVKLLGEIRDGLFLPDSTRSGRLVGRAEPFASLPDHQLKEAMPDWNIVHIKDESSDEEGHCTTCSSSSSSDECVVEPVSYRPKPFVLPEDTVLWKHKKLKTCHLMFKEHTKFFVCSRPCTEMYEEATPDQRFDVSKCRQCFKSKMIS